MGSYADVTISNIGIAPFLKNSFFFWFFRRSDKFIYNSHLKQTKPRIENLKIEPLERTDGTEDDRFLYVMSIETLKKRLRQSGYDLDYLKKEFLSYKEETKSTYQKYDMEIAEHNSFLFSTSIEDWLFFLKEKANKKLSEEPDKENDQRYEQFEINFNKIDFFDDIHILGIALSEVANNDASCILDISELIHGGWYVEFSHDDVKKYNKFLTPFYDKFDECLTEIESFAASTLHSINDLKTKDNLLAKILYPYVITAIDVYLSDTLIWLIKMNGHLKKRYYKIAKIDKKKTIESVVSDIQGSTLHSYKNFKEYLELIDISLPLALKENFKNMRDVRNDIARRYGYLKTELAAHSLSAGDIFELLNIAENIILIIDRKIAVHWAREHLDIKNGGER